MFQITNIFWLPSVTYLCTLYSRNPIFEKFTEKNMDLSKIVFGFVVVNFRLIYQILNVKFTNLGRQKKLHSQNVLSLKEYFFQKKRKTYLHQKSKTEKMHLKNVTFQGTYTFDIL